MFLRTEVYTTYHLNYPFQQKYGVPQKTLTDFTANEFSQPKRTSIKRKTLPQAHMNGICKTQIYVSNCLLLPFKNSRSVSELCLELC